MLTADTITDEQIRELRRQAIAADDTLTAASCYLALRADRQLDVSDAGRARLEPDIAKARARCAEILNARAAVMP